MCRVIISTRAMHLTIQNVILKGKITCKTNPLNGVDVLTISNNKQRAFS